MQINTYTTKADTDAGDYCPQLYASLQAVHVLASMRPGIGVKLLLPRTLHCQATLGVVPLRM